ncbi:basic secretory family protein [Pinibacter aurantiacus]|uniref:Basic secretory family protein n=1 Tax=Pinibacter aurantiacus TaxID=2851599 RepID=A0A9E2W8L0_9BACT|nr:basic secretory family protein [Pinibacter aurantiacus]MBV4358337.1 basic secretory family protein [Pinibacter aurantiacus]
MTNTFTKKMLTGIILAAIAVSGANAQDSWREYDTKGFTKVDSITKNGYTLIFVNKDEQFSDEVKKKMIDAYFKVYPKQAKEYNPKTIKKVTFLIDPTYDGVAATADGLTRYNPQWFRKNPQDIDVVTHEVMHITQSYPGGPGWVTEGIADYVRYTMGVANKEAGWALPAFSGSQHYDNSYRITARFFVWLTKNVRPTIVKELDKSMRDGTYTDDIWKKLTGKDVDELWAMYAQNPVI